MLSKDELKKRRRELKMDRVLEFRHEVDLNRKLAKPTAVRSADERIGGIFYRLRQDLASTKAKEAELRIREDENKRMIDEIDSHEKVAEKEPNIELSDVDFTKKKKSWCPCLR